MSKHAKFYVARRDTRYDVYPRTWPEIIVAHDYHGFWSKAADGEWYLDPGPYELQREISKEEVDMTCQQCFARYELSSAVASPADDFCSDTCAQKYDKEMTADAQLAIADDDDDGWYDNGDDGVSE